MPEVKLNKNPFLIFVPFLILYIILVLMYPTTGTHGDESRYLMYSRFMIDGYIPSSEIGFDHLGDGPGYPIFLIPFIFFKTPLIWITIVNACLLYLSLVLLFKSVIKFATFKAALIVGLFWGFYINMYAFIGKILPEVFSSFLVCFLVFSLVEAFKSNKRYLILSGFLMGYLALTKPIFGYVLLCMLIFAGILWLFNRKATAYKRSLVILAIAFVITTPYLIYTYSKTGKLFYWSTFGGNNLYWMSSVDEKEYGNYFADPGQPIDSETKKSHISNLEEELILKHGKDYEELNKYKFVELDDAYKRIAVRNIKNHPLKFLQNCFSNIGRILFNFPYSYKFQIPKTLMRLPFNGSIVVFLLIIIYPALRNWRKIEFSLRFMFLFALTYLGGSILGSAETRMFTLTVPILLFFIVYNFQRIFKIKLKFD